MAVERARVIFTGFVQGVGFRFTTKMLAGSYAVSGWVRNLPDGTVQLEAQGERDEVDRFVGRIRSEMKRNIVDVRLTWRRAKADEEGFVVRF